MHATALGSGEPVEPPLPLSPATEDLSVVLHRVAERLRHAADLADVCASGPMPDRGARYVGSIIAELAPDLATLARAVEPQTLPNT